MQFQGNFDVISKQLNLVDYGLFKHMNEAACPKIKTNLMIYIPLNAEKDEKVNILKEDKDSIPVRVLYHK